MTSPENNIPNNMNDLEPTLMEPITSDMLQGSNAVTENNSAPDTISTLADIREEQVPDTHQYIPALSNMSTVVAPTYGEEKKRSPLPFILIGVGAVIIGLIIFLCVHFFKGKALSDKERVFLATAKTLGDQSIFAVMGNFEDEAGNGMLLPGYIDDCRQAKTNIDAIMEQGASTQVVVKLQDLVFDDQSMGSFFTSLSGLALTANGQYAPKMGQIYEELKLTFIGFKIFSSEILLNETSMSVAVPELLDGFFTIDLLHFGRKYNETDFINGGELLPDAIAEALSISPLQLANFPDLSTHAFITSESAAESLLTFYNSIEVTKDETKKDVTVGGEPLRCEVFHMNIAKDDLQTFGNAYRVWYLDSLERYFKDNKGIATVLLLSLDYSNIDSEDIVGDLMAYLDENLSEDTMSEIFSAFEDNLTSTMLIDSDNRLISFTTETTINYDDETYGISADVQFAGKDYLCDALSAYVAVDYAGSTYSIAFTNNGSTTNNIRSDLASLIVKENGTDYLRIDLNAEYDLSSKHFHDEMTQYLSDGYDEYTLSYVMDGSTSIGTDKCTLDINSLAISYADDYDDDFTIELGINASISKLEDDLKQLHGTEYRIFDMTQEKFEEIGMEAGDFLYDLYYDLIW